MSVTRAGVLLGLATVFSATPGHADEGGVSLVVLSVPQDSASQKAAGIAGNAARSTFGRNPRYQPLDLEAFLDGAPDTATAELLQRAQTSMDKGSHALDENELDTALAALNDAAVAYEQATARLENVAPYVQTLLKLGVAYALNADEKSAAETFRRALLLDRTAALPNLPPAATKAFEDACKKVDEAERHTITVFSTPAAAEVFVDGVFRGPTPQNLDKLPAGPHLIRVYKPGYKSAGRAYKVNTPQDTVQFTLKPTARAAELEAFYPRLHQDVAAGQGPVLAELARFAKVDQVLVLSVQSTATDVRVAGTLVDNTGHTLSHGERTFTGDRFRAELDGWLEQGFKSAQGGAAKPPPKDATPTGSSNYATPTGGGGSPGMGKIIGGILLLPPLPVAAVLALVALAVTTLCWWMWATFPIPIVREGSLAQFNLSQRDTNYRVLLAILGVVFPVVTTGVLVAALASFGGGLGLIGWGQSDKSSMEAVMSAGGNGAGGEGGQHSGEQP